jgi:cation diffusion facilitator CzcD-associated flavoprotein CzcO
VSAPHAAPPRARSAIIGSEFGGLAAAIPLKRDGIQDFVLLASAGGISPSWPDTGWSYCRRASRFVAAEYVGAPAAAAPIDG